MGCFLGFVGRFFLLSLLVLEMQETPCDAMPLQEVQTLRKNLERLVSLVLARLDELDRRDHIATVPEQENTRMHDTHMQPQRALVPIYATSKGASTQPVSSTTVQGFYPSRKDMIYKPNYQRPAPNNRLYSGPIYLSDGAFSRRSQIPHVNSMLANRKPLQRPVYQSFVRPRGSLGTKNARYKPVRPGFPGHPLPATSYKRWQRPRQSSTRYSGRYGAQLQGALAYNRGNIGTKPRGAGKVASFKPIGKLYPPRPKYPLLGNRFRVQRVKGRYPISRYNGAGNAAFYPRYTKSGYQNYQTFTAPRGANMRRGYPSRIRPIITRYRVPLSKYQGMRPATQSRKTLVPGHLHPTNRNVQRDWLRYQPIFRRSRVTAGWPGRHGNYQGYVGGNRRVYRAVKNKNTRSNYEGSGRVRTLVKSKADTKTSNESLRGGLGLGGSVESTATDSGSGLNTPPANRNNKYDNNNNNDDDNTITTTNDNGYNDTATTSINDDNNDTTTTTTTTNNNGYNTATTSINDNNDTTTNNSNNDKNNNNSNGNYSTVSNQSDDKEKTLAELLEDPETSPVQGSGASIASDSSTPHEVTSSQDKPPAPRPENSTRVSKLGEVGSSSLALNTASGIVNSSRSTSKLNISTSHRVGETGDAKSSPAAVNGVTQQYPMSRPSEKFRTQQDDQVGATNPEASETGESVKLKSHATINREYSSSDYKTAEKTDYDSVPDASGEDRDHSGYYNDLRTSERVANNDLGTNASLRIGGRARSKGLGTIERAAYKFAGIKKKLPLTREEKKRRLYKSALYFARLKKKEKASTISVTSGDGKKASIDNDIASAEGSASADGHNQLLEPTKDSTIMGEDEVDEALKSSLKNPTSKDEEVVIDGGMSDTESDKSANENKQVHTSEPNTSKESGGHVAAIDDSGKDATQKAVDIDNKKGDDKLISIDVSENKKHHEASNIDGEDKSDAKQQATTVGVDASIVTSNSIDKVGKPDKTVEIAPASKDNQQKLKKPSSAKKLTAEGTGTTKATENQETLDKAGVQVVAPSKTSSFTSENQDQQIQFSNEAGNEDAAQNPPAIPVIEPEVANTIADQSAGLGPVTQAEPQTQSLSYADSQTTAADSQAPVQDNQAFTNENTQENGGQYSAQQTFICKDTNQTISCPPDQAINVLNADYGDKGDVGCMTQWDMGPSGPCRTPGAVDIVKDTCDGQSSCELSASNDVFGDSCPDSNKYLEVNYDCQAVPAIPPSRLDGDPANQGGQAAPQTQNYYSAPEQQQPQPAMAYAPQQDPASSYYSAQAQPALPSLMSGSPYSSPNPCDSCNTCSRCAESACAYCQNTCLRVICAPLAPPPAPPMPHLPRPLQSLWQQWNERTANMNSMEMSALIMSPAPKLPSAGKEEKETGSGESSADVSDDEMDDQELYDAADKKSHIPKGKGAKTTSS